MPLCSNKPRLLLGSSRRSGILALYDCVHAGGDVVGGDETVHTNVLFDSNRSAIVMRILSLLFCFLNVAFWLSNAAAVMQLPDLVTFSLDLLPCILILESLRRFIFATLTDFRLPRLIFSTCRCKFRRARFVGKTRCKAHRRRCRSSLFFRNVLRLLLTFTFGFHMLW